MEWKLGLEREGKHGKVGEEVLEMGDRRGWDDAGIYNKEEVAEEEDEKGRGGGRGNMRKG